MRALRFDPLEGRPCICELRALEATLTPANAAGRENGRDVFLTADPVYQVEIKGSCPKILHISGTVEVKDKDWALQRYQQMSEKAGRRWKFWK